VAGEKDLAPIIGESNSLLYPLEGAHWRAGGEELNVTMFNGEEVPSKRTIASEGCGKKGGGGVVKEVKGGRGFDGSLKRILGAPRSHQPGRLLTPKSEGALFQRWGCVGSASGKASFLPQGRTANFSLPLLPYCSKSAAGNSSVWKELESGAGRKPFVHH